MLQQQINYWTLKENMRHNRQTERIGRYEMRSNRMTAEANRLNANTNVYNAQINAINATSNRIQANAAATQAGAAVRQAGAAERQAGAAERQATVREREVTVKESQNDSVIFSNYGGPIGNVVGRLISNSAKVATASKAASYTPLTKQITGPVAKSSSKGSPFMITLFTENSMNDSMNSIFNPST